MLLSVAFALVLLQGQDCRITWDENPQEENVFRYIAVFSDSDQYDACNDPEPLLYYTEYTNIVCSSVVDMQIKKNGL
jgi:hypothetical protein